MIARTTLGRGIAVALAVSVSQVAAPIAMAAAPHLVDGQQLQQRLVADATLRATRVQELQQVLDQAATRQQAGAMGLNLGKLRAAVPHLSDAELADLSTRATQAKDLAAGYHNDGLAIAGLVLLLAGLAVLVAVADDSDYYDDCYCY